MSTLASVFKERTRYVAGALAVLVLLLVAAAYLRSQEHVSRSMDLTIGVQLNSCITGFVNKEPNIGEQLANFDRISGGCFNVGLYKVKIEEEELLRDNLVFQQSENIVLLIMVLIITLAGIILAGLQLLASYNLAMVRGNSKKRIVGQSDNTTDSHDSAVLAEGGEFSFSHNKIVVRSTTIGVIILGISLVFFIVFIMEVYTISELPNGSNADSAKQTTETFSQPKPFYTLETPPALRPENKP